MGKDSERIIWCTDVGVALALHEVSNFLSTQNSTGAERLKVVVDKLLLAGFEIISGERTGECERCKEKREEVSRLILSQLQSNSKTPGIVNYGIIHNIKP